MNQFRDSVILIALIICSITTAYSQNSNDAGPLSDIILIKNAQIIKSPGMPAQLGSILIEKGIIKQVGTVTNAPYNAQMIDMDSMYVYAGFIDGLSHTGIKKPDNKDRKKPQTPSDPTYEEVGIMPALMASAQWSADDKSVGSMRKSGITTSHTVPHGRIMLGQGAILNNLDADMDVSLVKDQTSLMSNFDSKWGAYPATTIGVISRWKELYKQAENAQKYELLYSKSKSGLTKPTYDKTLQALYPVINKERPVFFESEDDKTIHRVLALQKELGFKLVLTEVKNAANIADKIKKSGAAVLISIDLPEDKDKKKDKDGDDESKDKKSKEDKKADAKEDSATAKKEKKKKAKKEEPKDPETIALELRKKKAIAKYQAQAADFEKAGVAFGFSFLEGSAKDLHKSVRTMIEAGLSEKAALAALTTNPAQILGISDVAGSIASGKVANFVVTDKPYFEEKSAIKYVFVQGKEFKTKEKKKKSGGKAADGMDIAGEWTYLMEIPVPENSGTVVIEKDDENSFTFKVAAASDPADQISVDDVSLDDKTAKFSMEVDGDGGMMTLEWDITFDEDSYEGTVSIGQFGTFPVTGSKTSGSPE